MGTTYSESDWFLPNTAVLLLIAVLNGLQHFSLELQQGRRGYLNRAVHWRIYKYIDTLSSPLLASLPLSVPPLCPCYTPAPCTPQLLAPKQARPQLRRASASDAPQVCVGVFYREALLGTCRRQYHPLSRGTECLKGGGRRFSSWWLTRHQSMSLQLMEAHVQVYTYYM